MNRVEWLKFQFYKLKFQGCQAMGNNNTENILLSIISTLFLIAWGLKVFQIVFIVIKVGRCIRNYKNVRGINRHLTLSYISPK